MPRRSKNTFFAVLFAIAVGFQSPARADSCGNLTNLSLSRGAVTSARRIAPGEFRPPQGSGPGGTAAFRSLPAFCRVAATLKPSGDSDIKVEVWLPESGWNGKLQSVGNGAWAGSISYSALAAAVAAGYAAASTDTGHEGNTAIFVVGHPEKLADFAYRAVHEMTGAAKAIAAAYFGNAAKQTYFNGCSTGGRQALAEAQRYPADYDGIIAGAAANYVTHLQGFQVWVAQQAHKDGASYIPPSKYEVIHDAALRACDALDGVKDRVIEDPTRCHFDPAALACKSGDEPSCLTAPQVELARKIYAGPVNPRTKQQVFPGLEPGSEMGWAVLAGPQPLSLAAETYQYLVFHNPNWNYLNFDVDRDIAEADKVAGPVMNSTDANLKPFFAHGGKLLMYHGWADPGISSLNSVHYYQSVVDSIGGETKAADSIRLFMIPGMGHCRGGDGPDTFDAPAALDQWVVKHEAPSRIVAAHVKNGKADRTRPLCPYPQVAEYKGNGSTDEAQNFVCRLP